MNSPSGVLTETRRPDMAFRALIVPLFMASGGTSLVYETVWARQLQLIFGTSQVAISTVLAAFMAGLALGALITARWAARTRHPIVWYAALELCIGAYAALFPSILSLAEPIYLRFLSTFEPSPVVFGGFQLMLVGGLLLPPTVCMGATLPLLVRFMSAQPDDAGRQVGRLYGANTLGAVIGTGLAGFMLLPQLGLAATTYWAAGSNVVLATIALMIALRSGPLPVSQEVPHFEHGLGGGTDRSLHAGQPIVRNLLVIAGLAGFSSLLCEVAWFRLTALMLGGSAYAFSTMLLAFLLGIGIGGWVGGGMADRCLVRGGQSRVLYGLASIQVMVGFLCWGSIYLYGEMPFAYSRLFASLDGSLSLMWPTMLVLPLAVMLLPALFMGATFPYLVRAMAESGATLSVPVGRVYGVNTIGAIIGAAGGGLFLLPALQMRGAVLAAASVNLIAALIAATMARAVSSRLRRAVLVIAVLATLSTIALVHWHKPPWDARLMTAGLYSYVSTLGDLSREGVAKVIQESSELQFYEEGLSSVVTVERDPKDGNIYLANNGKVEASLYDMDTQLLLAHLPFAFALDAERVLVIGLASGITLGAVTLHPVQRIDLVELEPAIVAASHAFDAHNRRPLDDHRVRLIVNDGRNYLNRIQDGTYDVVSAQPSNPWLTGVSNLFTREFFQLGKRKMKSSGVWVQWLQTYSMGTDDVRSLLATFADVYEHVSVFRIGSSDLLLAGSSAELPLTAAAWHAIFENDAVAEDLRTIGIERAEDLLGLHQFSRDILLDLAGREKRNTDDNMRIEYSAPLKLYEDTRTANVNMLERHAEVALDAVDDVGGLLALAKSYGDQDPRWRRALETLQYATSLYPNDSNVLLAYEEAREKVRMEQHE